MLYYLVQNNHKKKFSYYGYTFKAPLWFGIWCIISLIISEYFNLSNRLRFFIVSILSSLLIIISAKYINNYNYTDKEWVYYYIRIFILYMVIWNVIIYNINKYI